MRLHYYSSWYGIDATPNEQAAHGPLVDGNTRDARHREAISGNRHPKPATRGVRSIGLKPSQASCVLSQRNTNGDYNG